jgi:hypothetical protein
MEPALGLWPAPPAAGAPWGAGSMSCAERLLVGSASLPALAAVATTAEGVGRLPGVWGPPVPVTTLTISVRMSCGVCENGGDMGIEIGCG